MIHMDYLAKLNKRERISCIINMSNHSTTWSNSFIPHVPLETQNEWWIYFLIITTFQKVKLLNLIQMFFRTNFHCKLLFKFPANKITKNVKKTVAGNGSSLLISKTFQNTINVIKLKLLTCFITQLVFLVLQNDLFWHAFMLLWQSHRIYKRPKLSK